MRCFERTNREGVGEKQEAWRGGLNDECCEFIVHVLL